jgi:DNA-binding Lrp family transcriptional regulator
LSKVLASVGIFVEKEQKQAVLASLSKLDNLEELYDVAGEYDIVSLVSANCLEELREMVLSKMRKIKGIRSTIINIVLNPHRELRLIKN